MKLELKHLAPYLPYGLKVLGKKHYLKYGESPILLVNGLAHQSGIKSGEFWQYEFLVDNDLKFSDINEKGFKPILRPLSDLTSEYYNNELKLNKGCTFHINPLMSYDILINRLTTNTIQYYDMQPLLANHFDVYGLIDKGLAIDINTLNQ